MILFEICQRVWKTVKCQGKIREKSGNLEVDDKWQPWSVEQNILLFLFHFRIKETLRVPPDHTFGILVKPDEYGAGDLMHMRGPGQYLRGKERQRGVLAAIRQHLKKSNYHNFEDLLAAFKHYDKVHKF